MSKRRLGVLCSLPLSAHALYGAMSMAALSQFARDGHIDADRLVDVLVPQLVASVRAPGVTATGRAIEGRPSA